MWQALEGFGRVANYGEHGARLWLEEGGTVSIVRDPAIPGTWEAWHIGHGDPERGMTRAEAITYAQAVAGTACVYCGHLAPATTGVCPTCTRWEDVV